jgi:hypothetical protein
MPNLIKYNVSAETLALKKGNFWIGTGDVPKGPTSTTGYWNGISPMRGGYTIYLNKVSNGPSMYAPSNDAQLIDITNKIAGTSYTTVNECFNYYAGQSDKMVFNRDFNGIITQGMVIGLSGSFISSYPRNGSTWYDITGNVNGGLANGATYSTDGMGCISFDGSDDLVSLADGVNTRFPNNSAWSIQLTFKINSFVNTYPGIIIKGSSGPGGTGILIFYMSNGVLYWKHYNGSGLLSSTITANSLINIAITYGGSGNVLGYLNGNYVGGLGTMSGTESSSALNLGVGDQYGNQNLYEFYKYDRQLSSTEVLQNFRNSDPKMFSSCKTCKDIIDNYPQLAGYDGLYWVYPGGPTSSPYQVHCDMTTDGGGWTLIARSAPSVNLDGENWGWKGGTVGNINDFSKAYQLGWGEIWDGNATFTSFIFGNQRTNVDNTWGPFIYKVSSINYSTFFNSDTQQSYTNSTIKSNTAVYGTSDFPGMQQAVGYTTTGTNNNIYYMRDCCGYAGYGGGWGGMTTVYCGAAFYYSGAWCGGETTTGGVYNFGTYVSNGLTYGGTQHYMIMVK